jgi:crotonobetainyl-CoA:carnitine CoA-transferase CaiB-like acyl-CoA transferase
MSALSDVRVLDLTDERGIYGAKLLADLGADVVRPEPQGGDALRQRGPHHEAAGKGVTSLWFAFYGSNRRFFTLNPATSEGAAQLNQLAASADIVLVCDGAFGVAALDLEHLAQQHPQMVIINTSSFGPNGPWRDFLAPDIVAGALGGVAATTGDVDTPPLKGFGELNFMVSGVYAAIAALAGLYCARQTGTGQQADVSVHETLVSCLEQVLMFYWYADRLMRPGRVLPRQGSTHWSGAYTVMKGQRGSIMVTPTPDFDNQLAWLIEENAHGDLIDPMYMEPENLPLRIQRTMALLREWVAGKDAETLFHEAQSRHCPYGWVLPIERVADNPQLQARDWYQDYQVGAVNLRSPGAPYQFSETPWSLGEMSGPDTQSVLADIGWGGK